MNVNHSYVFTAGEINLSVDEELALAIKEMLALTIGDYDVRDPDERCRIANVVDSIDRIDASIDESRKKMQNLTSKKPEEERLIDLFEDGKKEEENE